MQKPLFETIYDWVDKLVTHRLKEALFDKSYSGVISDVLFELFDLGFSVLSEF